MGEDQNVEENDPIAEVSTAGGQKTKILSPRSGLVLDIFKKEDLKPGMNLDWTLSTLSLATVGKLRPLPVSMEQKAVKATSEYDVFQEWCIDKSRVGKVAVEKDAPVAKVKNASGSLVVLKSPKKGTVEAIQPIKEGAKISEAMRDRTLAVIGKFPEVQARWPDAAVEVPTHAVFLNWTVQDGSEVEKGQRVAQVWTASGDRRLEAKISDSEVERELSDGEGTEKILSGLELNVCAPIDGYLGNLQPLRPGALIDEAQFGRVIATVRRPMPIYQLLAVVVCVIMWCCLFAVWKILKKPKPIYNHIIFDDPEESPSEDLQPESIPGKKEKQKKEKPPPPPPKKGVKLEFYAPPETPEPEKDMEPDEKKELDEKKKTRQIKKKDSVRTLQASGHHIRENLLEDRREAEASQD